MKNRKLLLAVLILFFTYVSPELYAQKQFNLTFDSAGKLIKFPAAVARGNKKVCPMVKVPESVIYEQLKPFRDLLQKTLRYLNEDTANYRNYYCYFETNSDVSFSKYVRELDSSVALLKRRELPRFLSLGSIQNSFDMLKYIPMSLFLKNLLQNQYAVRVKIGSTLVDNIPLDKVVYKNNCFYFEGKCRRVKDLACKSCNYAKAEELSFQLVQSDPLNSTVKQWFEIQNERIEIFTPEVIDSALKKMAAAPNTTNSDFITAHGKINKLKSWFASWFWYTGGKFAIDPIGVVDKTGVATLKDKIKGYDRLVQKLSRQKIFIDSALLHVNYSFRKFEFFKKVQAKQIALADQIDSISKLKNSAEKELAANSDKLLFLQTKTLVNNVNVVVTDFKHVRPQFQFDAGNKFRPIADSKRQLNRVSELPDNEQGYIVVHNIDSLTKLKFDQQRMPFKDDEEFTQLVSELLSQIKLTDLTPVEIGNLQNIFKSFSRTTGTAAAPLADSVIHCYENPFNNPVYVQIKEMAKGYVDNRRTVFYAKSIFEENDPLTPLYTSQREMVKFNTESPFRDSVSVKKTVAEKETPAFVTNVNVGKLRYVQVVLGLAVNQNPVERTTIDTAAAGFKVTTADNKARAVAGFKVYPFQSYNRDRWLIPRYPLHRVSLFGGFEMLHPLENFYVGAAYDIVPGLGISAGKNFYLETSYKIENGVVTDTFRSYQENKGLYYSVNVNPVLFVKFVQLFFKTL